MAFIADYIVVWFIAWILSIILISLYVFSVNPLQTGFWLGFGLLHGVLFLVYSIILEATSHKTIGKWLLTLKVTHTGPENTKDIVLRNLTKVHWVLLLLDMLAGMVSHGDPKQRYLDRLANTVVVTMPPALQQDGGYVVQGVAPAPQPATTPAIGTNTPQPETVSQPAPPPLAPLSGRTQTPPPPPAGDTPPPAAQPAPQPAPPAQAPPAPPAASTPPPPPAKELKKY